MARQRFAKPSHAGSNPVLTSGLYLRGIATKGDGRSKQPEDGKVPVETIRGQSARAGTPLGVTFPPAPRVTMVRGLAAGMAESYAAGDLEAARVAVQAIALLVGSEFTVQG